MEYTYMIPRVKSINPDIIDPVCLCLNANFHVCTLLMTCTRFVSLLYSFLHNSYTLYSSLGSIYARYKFLANNSVFWDTGIQTFECDTQYYNKMKNTADAFIHIFISHTQSDLLRFKFLAHSSYFCFSYSPILPVCPPSRCCCCCCWLILPFCFQSRWCWWIDLFWVSRLTQAKLLVHMLRPSWWYTLVS